LPVSDAELVTRFRSGDDLAYVLLYNRYKRQVVAFCRGYVGGDEAEDLAHDVFLRIYRRRGTLQDGNFRALLFKTARNLCLNALRSKSQHLQLEAFPEQPNSDPETDFATRNLLAYLLARLTSEERELLLLREAAGFSYQELGDFLGKKPGTVRVQLYRIRDKLRTALVQLKQQEQKSGQEL